MKGKEKSRLLLVSGMSGAGKTQAMRALEDMGYFCIDNYPFSMIDELLDGVLLRHRGQFPHIAIAADVRGREFLSDVEARLKALRRGVDVSVLYMDARNDVLMNRYKETRRRHPLQTEERGLMEAISQERAILSPLRGLADRVVDSSDLQIADFRLLLHELYGGEEPRMSVTVASFGYKYGLPLDADLVLDVRFLPNPFYDPELRPLTGRDQAVRDYVLGQSETDEFLSRIEGLLSFLLPEYVREGKKMLVVGIGCTGGQHRSVALADAIGGRLRGGDVEVFVKHRELHRYLNRG